VKKLVLCLSLLLTGLPSVYAQEALTVTQGIDGDGYSRVREHSCDINWDGQCNEEDHEILEESLGKCWRDFPREITQKQANVIDADFDGDGCVDEMDQRYWEEEFARFKKRSMDE